MANRQYYRQKWTRYLGELRPIHDIFIKWESLVPTPTPAPSCDISYVINPTPTPSVTPTLTVTPSSNPIPVTPSVTPSITPTLTPTITPTSSGIPVTPTVTPTKTMTPTPSPTAFNTEYTTLLNRATELGYDFPSDAEQRRQNQLITDLKSVGVYQKLGFLYVFAQNLSPVGAPAFSLLNWITPANSPLALRRTTTGDTFPSFVNYSGWSFNQNNSIEFILPSNPMAASVNPITAASGGSEGVWVMAKTGDSTSGTNAYYNSNNNGWNRLLANNTTGHWLFRGIGLTTNADLTGTGFRAGSLSGAVSAVTAVELYSGITKLSRTKTSVDTGGVGGGGLFINGTTNQRFSWNCGMFFSGLALSETEMNNLHNAFQTYLNTST